MNEIPISFLFGILALLVLLSGFFSGSETALMTLNRHRLKHLAENVKKPNAIKAKQLLDRPDRLIGLILLGNNFVNILASSLSTVIAIRLFGEKGIAIAAILLTFVILIFAEVTPKTLAALYPEKIAFPAARIHFFLLKVFYPLVWVVNSIVNIILRFFDISMKTYQQNKLSHEELRTVVHEAETIISYQRKEMLLSILDLEKATIENIMIPRNEVMGIDINESYDKIMTKIGNCQYARLVVYENNFDNIIGVLHIRKALYAILNESEITESQKFKSLTDIIDEAYFVPKGTSLNQQMLHFQKKKKRLGLVVDEYGDFQGLVTLEDILEEIVGEYTTDPSTYMTDFYPQKDGCYLIDGSAYIKELNKTLKLELPHKGPKTLNGVILEYLESIPEPGTSLLLNGYPVEILQTKDNVVKMVKLQPKKIHKDLNK